MDNGVGFDEMDEPVRLSPSGRKQKKSSDSYARNVAKRIRHSGYGIEPTVKCGHKSSNLCKAVDLSNDELVYINNVLYATSDKVKQDAILLSYMDVQSVKRRRSKVDTPKSRSTSVKYYVVTDSSDRLPVCKEAFMSIFGVKGDRLCRIAKYWLENGVARPENRGGNRNANAKSIQRAAVREHITYFTCRASHYARRGSPGRKYLPCDMNVKKMHQMFLEQNHEQISYSLYYSIFAYDFNLSFGHPSKDVCSTCLRFKIEMKNPDLSDATKRTKTALQVLHRRRARQFYNNLNDVGDSFTICFDVMENIVLPKSSIGEAYYSRQLYLYVFGIIRHRGQNMPQRKEDIHLFIWSETDNRKDSNMIASALNYYLRTVARHELQEHNILRLFSDSCYGQNKNINVIAMLFALRSQQYPELDIQYTFPVRGHSFLPADRVFGRLEQAIRKQDTILLPSEYVEMFKKHGNVHLYENDWDSYDYKHESKMQCSSVRSFKISQAKILEISGDKLGMKDSYSGDITKYSILKRGRKWEHFHPKQLEPINCVTDAKKTDVFKLLKSLGAPQHVNHFYEDVFGDTSTKESAGKQDLEDTSDEEE